MLNIGLLLQLQLIINNKLTMGTTENLFNEFEGLSNDDWKKLILKSLKLETNSEKEDFYNNKLKFRPSEGLEFEPFYTQKDLKGLEYLNGYTNLLSLTKQTTGWMNIENIMVENEIEANLYARKVLNQGADGICFDILKINNIDFKILLNEISFSNNPVYFVIDDINSLLKYLSHTYSDTKRLMGGIFCKNILNTDIDKLIFYFKDADFFKSLIFENNIELDHVSQISNLLLNAIRKVEELHENGISFDNILKKIAFKINVKNDFFIEIAKFRVLRMLWWHIAKSYDDNLNLIDVFIYSSTSLSNATEEPYKNFISNTTQAMSAVIGGSDAISVTPTYFENEIDLNMSKRISRNVSVILKEESYFDKVNDMGSGSYLIENITHQIAIAVWKKITENPILG